MIPSVAVKNTQILCSVYTTAMSSPEGYVDGTSYVKDNIGLTRLNIIFLKHQSCLQLPNKQMSSSKSFECQLQLASFNPNVSPVIDVGTIGVIGFANRLNNIDSS